MLGSGAQDRKERGAQGGCPREHPGSKVTALGCSDTPVGRYHNVEDEAPQRGGLGPLQLQPFSSCFMKL